MKRDIYHHLETWKRSPQRKPLIINGARQVGKTYAITHFGKTHYTKIVQLNFEKDKKLANYFAEILDPQKLIQALQLHTGIEIDPRDTLLLFDEVQACPRALTSLKYFCEEANEYHIIAAGSLLGVKTAGSSGTDGFPVGKVDFLHLYPLSFFEFLSAINQGKLRAFLEDLSSYEPIPSPLHDQLIHYLKTYLFVGGMPEAVASYAHKGDLNAVRKIQLNIILAYEQDFSKHAPPHEIMKITTVWSQVPEQLAKENKKFIFAAIRQSARGREYEDAIQWLASAGLIYKSLLTETPKFPLKHYADAQAFKLFLLDVGLLGAQSNLSPQVTLEENAIFTEFKGALTENFVAQELMAADHRRLYYWTSARNAEVDFLLEGNHSIYPLEVKAGTSQKKKSLLVYDDKYTPSQLTRATLMNLKHDGKIRNLPLYLVSRFSKLT